MKKKFTMLFAALLAFVGVAKAQTVVGLKEVPTTAVDLSTTELTTGYYLIKQTNTADYHGFLKATSEAEGAVVTPNGAPTANADTEATYIWYVEVAQDGKFSIATANKVAGWQAPTQKQKNLVAYDDKATTLELEKDFASLNKTTQTLIKAYWEAQSCYSYVHASGHNLGSWNDQNTASLFYIEFYAIPESDLIIYDPVGVAKLALSEEIEKISATLGALPLQTANATGEYYLSATEMGDAPISAAIDNNPATYYGSTWGSEVGSHHYWQVDLGDGVSLSSFVFSYITRANGSDTPTKIDVKGSNDGEDFTTIVTLTAQDNGLPTAGGASYTSASISNTYRYIRFEVPSTTNNFSFPKNTEQEVTIAIAEFKLFSKDENNWSEKDKRLKAAVEAAQAVIDDKDVTVEDVENALHTLKLAAVDKPVYPFTVTTDDANPVVYAIKSGRGEAYWYTYDEKDGMIALAEYEAAQTQFWYFKEVLTADYVYALQLFPYLGAGKAMSYQNTNNDPAKIVAQTLGTEGWTNLWLLATTNGEAPYGLQTYNKANYLSNNGGVTNKMGMWNAAPANDGGTAMYFVNPAEALESLIAKAKDMLSTEGTGVGYCTAESVANLRAVIAQAEAGLEEKNYSVDALNEAIAALETIQPEVGKFYVISSAMPESDGRSGKMMYVNADGGMQFDNNEEINYIFRFESAGEGKFYLYNVENGSYLNTAKDHNGGQAEAKAFAIDGAKAVTITNMGRSNAVKIVPEGGAMLHAQAAGSKVVAWNNDENAGASAWTIAEVEFSLTDLNHTLAVSEAGWATLVLGYNTTIPTGVKAYAVSSITEGKAVLTEVAKVLPAHTPVLIEAAKGEYAFNYTADEATVASNLLAGSVFNTYVAPVEGTTNYVLSNNNDVVALYKKTTTNDAGKIVFAAKKAYLPVETATEGAPAMFAFSRGGDDESTGIDQLINANGEVVIYDLAGRRIEKMEKGIYIVNGKKVVK